MFKLLLLGLMATLFSFTSFAAMQGAPFPPAIDKRFDLIERSTGDVTFTNGVSAIGAGKVTGAMHAQPTIDGNFARLQARATLNCASSGCSIGAHGLGVSLPAKALITQSYLYVVAQFTDSGTCTVAISCEDANNIKTATDISGSSAGAFIAGESTGAASAFKASIAAACEITATIADGGSCVASTVGKAIVFVDYTIVE